jgi:hypothetical protein
MGKPFFANKMSITERIVEAKRKTERVVDHVLYLLALHENNALVTYSPLLSAQIPASYAANAFNVFQQGLHRFEIVRLCTLWDSADPYKENIPTIAELIDSPLIIEALAIETASHWKSSEGVFLNPSDSLELKQMELEELRSSEAAFGLVRLNMQEKIYGKQLKTLEKF